MSDGELIEYAEMLRKLLSAEIARDARGDGDDLTLERIPLLSERLGDAGAELAFRRLEVAS